MRVNFKLAAVLQVLFATAICLGSPVFKFPNENDAPIPVTVQLRNSVDGVKSLYESLPFIHGFVPDHKRTQHALDAYVDADKFDSVVDILVSGGHKVDIRHETYGAHVLSRRNVNTFDAKLNFDDEWNDYHDHKQLEALLQALTQAYPKLVRPYAIGRSVRGRTIWAIEVSSQNGDAAHKPEVKYVANIHGDEVVGRELCLRFIHELAHAYTHDQDERITRLVDNTRIHIVPTANPDGFEMGRRHNAHFKDLNRDFDDPLKQRILSTLGHQPEVQALMTWSANHDFVLSAVFHGGATVANYPMDCAPNYRSGTYAAAPDDALFRHLASVYASHNDDMHNSKEFPGGITNGNHWYCLIGGSQDWNYLYTSDMELTLEVSDIKWPHASTLGSYWASNYEAMVAYLEQAHTGVRGSVLDSQTGSPLQADITFISRNNDQKIEIKHSFSNADSGFFHRILIPGIYDVVVSKDGYQDQKMTGLRVDSSVPYKSIKNIVVAMHPKK